MPVTSSVEPCRARTKVPIYRTDLYLVVDHSILEAFTRLPRFFSDVEFDPTCTAHSLANGRGDFALLFQHQSCTHPVLSHEISHLAGDIMEFIGQKKLDHGSEVVAYLDEWLTGWVLKQLNKRGILL